jgi:hypothetical protein
MEVRIVDKITGDTIVLNRFEESFMNIDPCGVLFRLTMSIPKSRRPDAEIRCDRDFRSALTLQAIRDPDVVISVEDRAPDAPETSFQDYAIVVD